jgi:2-hydroxy-3-keto-5-methylthiopentenyl-1-phosphate phosphatase
MVVYPDSLADIKLDSGFKDFFKFCKSQDIPVIIVSRFVLLSLCIFLMVDRTPFSGMAPIIRAVLSKLIGEEDAQTIEIISNDVNMKGDAKHHWNIQYRHPTR